MCRVLALVVDGPFVAEFPFCVRHRGVVSYDSALACILCYFEVYYLASGSILMLFFGQVVEADS